MGSSTIAGHKLGKPHDHYRAVFMAMAICNVIGKFGEALKSLAI
jgi:hypothetical protein